MSGARAAAPADADAAKGRVSATVVPRYRAGQAPHYAGGDAGAAGDDGLVLPASAAPSIAPPCEPAPPVVLQDPRLARLAAVDATAGPRRRVREVAAPEIVRPARDSGATVAAAAATADVSDDELARRREAVRERARAAAAAAAEAAAAEAAGGAAGDDDGVGESSSYETDSEDDDSDGGGLAGGGRLLKPVFMPRGARDTAPAGREVVAAAVDDDDDAAAAAAAAARAAETRAMVARVIAADDAAEAAAAAGPIGGDGADIDTDEEAAAADDAAAWREREFARLARDAAAESTADDAAAAERAAVAALSEGERAARAAAIKAERDAAKGAKPKLGFMQKYHHRGAFFQDNADAPALPGGGDYGVAAAVAARDAAAATGDDAWIDKAALPKVMQVKNFGRRGGSKYTHLADQDTGRVVAAAEGSGAPPPLRPARELEAKRAARLPGTGHTL